MPSLKGKGNREAAAEARADLRKAHIEAGRSWMGNTWAKLTEYGVSRTNRFSVIIHPPPAIQKYSKHMGERLELQCETAGIPGRSIMSKPVRHFGPPRESPYGQLFPEAATFTFRVGRDFMERRFFEEWQNAIIDPVSHEVNYYKNYVGSIEVVQRQVHKHLTHVISGDGEAYRVLLLEAYPKIITEMPVDNTAENTIHKLNISFAYRKWLSGDLAGKHYDFWGTKPVGDIMSMTGAKIPEESAAAGGVITGTHAEIHARRMANPTSVGGIKVNKIMKDSRGKPLNRLPTTTSNVRPEQLPITTSGKQSRGSRR